MTSTPQRLLFSGLFICMLLGITVDIINNRLSSNSNIFPPEIFLNDSNSLSVGRHYWRIGRFEKAIEEYQRVIPTLPKENVDSAYEELKRLILLEQSSSGRVIGDLTYYAWLLPQKLYGIAGIFFLVAIVLLGYRLTRKTPKFIIHPFNDRAGLNIGDNLSLIAIDRIHEIEWRTRNLEAISDLIADNIEIPTLSLMSEGDNQGAIELLDIALLFSIGSTDLHFSHVINAIKLWLEQPNFIVRGVIDKQGNVIILKMSLINRKKNDIEKVWRIEIPYKDEVPISKVVDAIIYPLLFHFNEISAMRWEALQALHNGIEEFQFFKENQSTLTHLELAQQELERAILFDPGYELARYNLSLLLLATGEFERSREYLRELSALSTDHQLRLRAKYSYGIALFHISQDWAYEQAVKIFQELLNQSECGQLGYLIRSALSIIYAKMAERHPKERESLVNKSLEEANNVIEDIESLKRKTKRFKIDIHSFKDALTNALANAFAAKAFAYMASKNYKQAIEYFKESVKTRPGSLSNMLGLGEAYYRNNLKDEALDTFRKAAIQSPLSRYTRYRLGNLYRELGKRDEAINVLKGVLQYAYASLTLGKIYLEDDEFEKALAEFREATCLNGHLSEAWVNIAWTILQLEDPTLTKEALRAARRALQLEKNDKQLWHRHAILAFCLHKSRKNELALNEAKKAVELEPNQAQAHYYLALAQYELGQFENARQSIEKVIGLDKKGNWAPKALQLLSQLQ